MIKLYLDEDVHKKVATALRLKGYDVISAHEVQNNSLTDKKQLEFASTEHRAIFTFNAADFDKLHKELLAKGALHYGIILAKQITLGETVKRLSKFLSSHTAEEVRSNIYWV